MNKVRQTRHCAGLGPALERWEVDVVRQLKGTCNRPGPEARCYRALIFPILIILTPLGNHCKEELVKGWNALLAYGSRAEAGAACNPIG